MGSDVPSWGHGTLGIGSQGLADRLEARWVCLSCQMTTSEAPISIRESSPNPARATEAAASAAAITTIALTTFQPSVAYSSTRPRRSRMICRSAQEVEASGRRSPLVDKLGARYSRDESEFDRAIGFLDATFALAPTLLVTTIDVSDPASVWKSLSTLNDDVGPQLIAFGITFAVITNYWLVHHRMIADFAYIDVPVMVANLFLIAAIVLLPFSTRPSGIPRPTIWPCRWHGWPSTWPRPRP